VHLHGNRRRGHPINGTLRNSCRQRGADASATLSLLPGFDPQLAPDLEDLVRIPTHIKTMLLLSLVALALGAPAAQAAPGMEIGLQDDDVFVHRSYFTPEKGYAAAEQLGVSRLRINVYWARAVGASGQDPSQPNPIPYDWAPYDRAINEAAARGIRVQLTLTGQAPAWATGNRKASNFRPNVKKFHQFAADAAAHFKGRVDRYSIWNEPNWSSWLLPHRFAAKTYRDLYTGAYAAIKRNDPAAAVLIGELAPIGRRGISDPPLAFLRNLACVGPDYKREGGCAPLKADGFAHHPYTLDFGPYFPGLVQDDVTTGSLVRLTSALTKVARSKALSTPSGQPLDLFLTEYGFFARGKRSFPDAERASNLVRGFAIAQRNPRVREMVQFMLVQSPPQYPWDTSLISQGGIPSPAFMALSGWLQQAVAAGQIKVAGPLNLPESPDGPPPPPQPPGANPGTPPPAPIPR